MSQPLATRCSQQFSAKDIAAATSDIARRRATLAGVDASYAFVEIYADGKDYQDVEIDWSTAGSSAIGVHCSCDAFARGYSCRHIYAALLTVDQEGLVDRLPGTGPLKLYSLAGRDDLDDEDDQYDKDTSLEEVFGDDGDMKYGKLGRLAETAAKLPPHLRNAILQTFPSVGPSSPKPPDWRKRLESVARSLGAGDAGAASTGLLAVPRTRQAWFRLNIDETFRGGRLTLDFYVRETKKKGGFGKLKELRVGEEDVAQFADPVEREVLGLLLDGGTSDYTGYYYAGYQPKVPRARVRPPLYSLLLPRLCATGRLGWSKRPPDQPEDLTRLAWDDGPPWQFELTAAGQDKPQVLTIGGLLRSGERTARLEEPLLLLKEGLIVFPDRIARLEVGEGFAWISHLRSSGPIEVPQAQRQQFVEQLWQLPALPVIKLPAELRWEQVRLDPHPQIVFKAPRQSQPGQALAPLEGLVSFDYGGHKIPWWSPQAGMIDRKNLKVYLRDRPRERAALAQLHSLGLKSPPSWQRKSCDVHLAPKLLPRVVQALVAAGWHVEAEGHKIRRPGQFSLSVTSGVDWFELSSEFDFDGVTATLPELLAALRRGEQFVVLSDGSHGMLPEEWLQWYAPLAELGEAEGDTLRFKPTQAALLDALLAAQPHVNVDEKFERWRDKLRGFAGVAPADQPAGFVGTLRDYQREGLGWLGFLQEFSFGGCLADDMGLGKTIQVLALLEQRRSRPAAKGENRLPSLAVVPRSLVHNWIEEAQRFAPQLKVLDYTGLERAALRDQFDQHDLIVTTYGTLRRDIALLQDRPFDLAILDEAQAIKNSASQAAKACRLVQARQRLGMTGTPVENHLGELWSLFEFLNPGMLGRSSAVKPFAVNGRGPQDGSLQLLSQALRPYILRRTKEQVLRELPEKTEQTLYCELDEQQQKLYDELRDHYRALLTKKIKQDGLQKSKIQVLEALLRLRQAACHPGLLDKKKVDEPSAKLETLLEQLREVLDEGHKALVFSQFTSLLAIVRRRLDQEQVPYEYLDGKTRNRKEKVDHFQQQSDCRLFLVSLKAGGLGLNLTAADYVFILDPWWNPAVEAQAVDRAHRIGQTRPVFAYRLIARGTVEEKILELQREKRNLAESIITADNSLIRSLTADDLRLLLS